MSGRDMHVERSNVPAIRWGDSLNPSIRSARTYPPGVVLFHQGDCVEDVFVVEHGLIKLRRVQPGGKETILGVRSAGAFLGAAAAILDEPHSAAAVTVTSCRLVRIEQGEFLERIHCDPAFSWRLHEEHSREVCGESDHLAQLGCEGARVRLKRFLFQIAAEFGAALPEGGFTLTLPLKQWEVAQLLSVTPQYLCQLLGELERSGLLRRDGPSIVVHRHAPIASA